MSEKRGMQGAAGELEGQLVDVVSGRMGPARVCWAGGRITSIERLSSAPEQGILPGMVDAHVHVESSMLLPFEFARLALTHGTLGSVSDPHEIANVLGLEGVRLMVRSGSAAPFHFCFGAPSCVPATQFETAGAVLGVAEIEALFRDDGLTYLSEVMNYPAVLQGESEMAQKLALAKRYGCQIDGHAPGLRGEKAARYAAAGITTDHECTTIDEARDKIAAGMRIAIREGSAARNFEALAPLFSEAPAQLMLCSDDLHPDALVRGHINLLVQRALDMGFDPLAVFRAATLNPVRHYRLPLGLLQVGDPADFIVTDSLRQMQVRASFFRGECVARDGEPLVAHREGECANRFERYPIRADQLKARASSPRMRVIEVQDGALTTSCRWESVQTGEWCDADPTRDLLKLVVVNRYTQAPPAVAFVRGIGLRHGALASSVAHDSHNIVAVGTNDDDLVQAIALVQQHEGGITACAGPRTEVLPLPLAGLMSLEDGRTVAAAYERLDRTAKELGSPLRAPFMTLSFLALLVIPALKLSDRGLFDGVRFELCELFG